MDIMQEFGHATYVIRGYDKGNITVNDTTYTSSLVIMPEHLIHDWAPRHIEELTTEHLMSIRHLNPEVVLIGSGEKLKFPAREILNYFMDSKIGVEVMDTGAACRTYNILMSEGRSVAAALIID